jgi:hypothetical protein
MILIEIGCEVCGMDSAGSRQRPVTGFCEHGNESSGTIKVEGFLDKLSEYYFVKEEFLSNVLILLLLLLLIFQSASWW